MDKESTEPLLFQQAIELLPNNQLYKKKVKEEGLNQNVPFLQILEKNMDQFLFLQTFLYLRLVILQHVGNSMQILYSGLFSGPNLNPAWPIQIWIFNSKGHILRKENCLSSCPKLNRYKQKHFLPQQNLSTMLGLTKQYPDPIDFQSTIEFLTKHNKLDHVQINYCYSYHSYNGAVFWNDPLDTKLYIEAFTTFKYQLGFRIAKLTSKTKQKKVTINNATEIGNVGATEPNIRQANKSSAISVKLAGLNLAFNLGIIMYEQVAQLSLELGKCAASIWMEYDTLFNARYVTVCAAKQIFQTEIINQQSWIKVFDFIYKIKFEVAQQKRQILDSVLTKLSNVSQSTHSPFKSCVQQLMHTIEHLTVVLFSTDDTCIHAIKLYLCAYLKETKKKYNIIHLNTSSTNTINMLRTKELTFLNLNMYLDDDAIFKSTLPKPVIVHYIKRLFHQPKIDAATTLLCLCKKRGKEIAPQLLICWLTIGQFFIDHFELDIFASHFRSISYLAFVAVWSKYAKTSGVFHQGLEKTKAAYEKIFRSFSHGGFSYSCKDYLECGQPIFGTHGEHASSLFSLDITSSYGYAGSQIQIPTGFCNAYFDNGCGFLQLCEPFSRHNSFEFLSVYYTLYLLSLEQSRQVKTVFSNFHSNGIFYIKRYPIDLVVIFSNGDISLFQFDGAYAHGCREGCQLFSSFVRGRQRKDLETETQKRDDVINLWVKETNEMSIIKALYVVITDCHDDNYKLKRLKQHFHAIPLLSSLISSYPTAKTCTQDDVLFSNDNLTFIIVLEGFVPLKSDGKCPKPLLCKNEEQNWSRQNATTSRPILLTKDYLNWLTKHYNFQVTKIHSVFFYKKCNILNLIYTELTLLRMNPNISNSIKQLVKNVVNFSAGYFGLNEKKGSKMTFKLLTGVGSKYTTKRHVPQYLATINNLQCFIVGTARSQKNTHSMSIAPFPIFLSIVEFGKKRLSEILCFFDKFLLSSHYRHLYSNVDNILFVISTPSIDQSVDPQLFKQYCKEKCNFFNSVPLPGYLKQDLHVTSNQEWKFVSPVIMNYCIKTNESHKTIYKCLFNNVTGEQAFENSFKMLKKEKLQVQQTRRIDKVVNKNVKTLTFNFNEKK
jgi:hypothetical protein